MCVCIRTYVQYIHLYTCINNVYMYIHKHVHHLCIFICIIIEFYYHTCTYYYYGFIRTWVRTYLRILYMSVNSLTHTHAHTHTHTHVQVRSVVWNNDDTHLVTCSTDGAVYDWNVQTYQRENDCVVKNCSYTSIAISSDLKSTFAVGSDCTLKEINLTDSAVSKRFHFICLMHKSIICSYYLFIRTYVRSSCTVLPCTHARICMYIHVCFRVQV